MRDYRAVATEPFKCKEVIEKRFKIVLKVAVSFKLYQLSAATLRGE